MNDIDREPLTIGPEPGPKVSIKLGELIAAVRKYLRQKTGIHVDGYDLEQDSDARATIVKFHGITLPDGKAPIEGVLRFEIGGICARSENARLGGNTRPITVQKQKHTTQDYFRKYDQWKANYRRLRLLVDRPAPPELYETVVDLVAEPNVDRSITFFVIDRWEGNTAHYRRRTASANREAQPLLAPVLSADRLTRPATVTCLLLRGEPTTFHVTIEKVYWLTEPGEGRRLCFRGKAKVDGWAGHKTFFADECTQVFEEPTGTSITDIPSWLLAMTAEPTPLTLASIINAVCAVLDTQHDILSKNINIGLCDNGSRVIVFSGISRSEQANASASEAPPQEVAFIVTPNNPVASLDDSLGIERADIRVNAHWGGKWDGPDVRTFFSITVTACEAGRVEITPQVSHR